MAYSGSFTVRWQEAAEKQLSYLAGAAAAYHSGNSSAKLTMLGELWPTAEPVCTGKAVPGEL